MTSKNINKFQSNENQGKVKASPDVLYRILTSEEDGYAGRFRFNLLTSAVELNGKPMRDVDYTALRVELDSQRRGVFGIDDVRSIVALIAMQNEYHPVVNYLSGITWDGTDWIHQLAEQMQITSKPIHEIYLRKFLISAVARVRKPGCKLDTMPILYEPIGGVGKSTCLLALCPDTDWYCGSWNWGQTDKDGLLVLHSKFLVEVKEMSGFGKRENETIKAFVENTDDKFRKPYGAVSEKHERQFVLIGTNNNMAMFRDSNTRRFWVIETTATRANKINSPWIREHRDQIWAQADALFKSGEEWWLTSKEDEVREENDTDHMVLDIEADIVSEWLSHMQRDFSAAEFDYKQKGVSYPFMRDRFKALAEKHGFIWKHTMNGNRFVRRASE